MESKMTFERLLEQYVELATKHAEAKERCRTAWAKAFLGSKEKNDTGRKAEADVATGNMRLERDKLEIEAAAAWQAMLKERGNVGASGMPGSHFGD